MVSRFGWLFDCSSCINHGGVDRYGQRHIDGVRLEGGDPMIKYIEKGYSMHEWLQSQGVALWQSGDEWFSTVSDETVNALIQQYNPWPSEKAAKLKEINEWFSGAVNQLTSGIPQEEKDSWSVQVSEANGLIPQQMLPVMAAARGISVDELVAKVKAKSALFAQYYGAIQGKRDKAEDLIKSLPDSGSIERLPELWAIKCTD